MKIINVFRNRKAQVAIEYLFSYGWVLLLMFTIVLVALSYGLLSPDKYVSEKCSIGELIICKDFSADKTGNIELILTNNYKFSVEVFNLSIPDMHGISCNGPLLLYPGMTDVLFCQTNSEWAVNSKQKFNLKVHFHREGIDSNHTAGGQIVVKILDSIELLQCGGAGTNTYLCTGGEECDSNSVVFVYATTGGTCCLVPCSPPPECRDGLDNDFDGCIDFGWDTGCVDANDPAEGPENCGFNSIVDVDCSAAGGVCCQFGCTDPMPQHYCDQSGVGDSFCCRKECAILA